MIVDARASASLLLVAVRSSSSARPSRSCRSSSSATAIFAVHERDRLHRRARALRRDHLPAALPAGRARRRAPPAPGLQLTPLMGGLLVTSIASGQLISQLRPLQGVPDRRHGDHDRRHVAALALARRTRRRGVASLYMLVARARARDGDAGARARRPERRRLPASSASPRPARRSSARSAARSASPSSARSSSTGCTRASRRRCRRRGTVPKSSPTSIVKHLPPASTTPYVQRVLRVAPSGVPRRRRHRP